MNQSMRTFTTQSGRNSPRDAPTLSSRSNTMLLLNIKQKMSFEFRTLSVAIISACNILSTLSSHRCRAGPACSLDILSSWTFHLSRR
jgi:hypothetical protein